jgi:hypothetical protein
VLALAAGVFVWHRKRRQAAALRTYGRRGSGRRYAAQPHGRSRSASAAAAAGGGGASWRQWPNTTAAALVAKGAAVWEVVSPWGIWQRRKQRREVRARVTPSCCAAGETTSIYSLKEANIILKGFQIHSYICCVHQLLMQLPEPEVVACRLVSAEEQAAHPHEQPAAGSLCCCHICVCCYSDVTLIDCLMHWSVYGIWSSVLCGAAADVAPSRRVAAQQSPWPHASSCEGVTGRAA